MPALPVGRFWPDAAEPTQLAMPAPPWLSAQPKLSGTGWPCVYTAPSAMLTVIAGPVWSTRKDCDLTADWLPFMSTASHLTVCVPSLGSVSTSPIERARWLLYVGEVSVGVEPSVV